MTPEAQRIAIAEACGWTNVEWQTFPGGMQNPLLMGSPPGKNVQRYVPDYLSDLNAMHEAEKILGLGRCDDYEALLQQIVATESISKSQSATDGRVADLFNWHATSAQRAEAFLRTLNLWKDEPVPDVSQTPTLSGEKKD